MTNPRTGKEVTTDYGNPIVSVAAMSISGGWRYVATLTDGTSLVVRRRSTRLYDNAFIYNCPRVQSNVSCPIASRMSFGMKEKSGYRSVLLARFEIVEVSHKPDKVCPTCGGYAVITKVKGDYWRTCQKTGCRVSDGLVVGS